MNRQTNELPGIIGLLDKHPDSGTILKQLAHKLLWDKDFSPIPPGYRELIAAYVSQKNECEFCYRSHRAFAEEHLGKAYVSKMLDNDMFEDMPKMGFMLSLAELTVRYPNNIIFSDIELMKNNGLSEKEIHDVILISSAFCMYNKYVSASGVSRPPLSDQDYSDIAIDIVANGYADQLVS